MADIVINNQTEPATPTSGNTTIYVDGTAKTIYSKDDAGVVTPYASSLEDKVMVSSNDTTNGYLEDKIVTVANSGLAVTTLNDGGDEDLQIATDITNATDLAAPAIADELLISDADDSNTVKKADVASVVNLADHDALTNYAANQHRVWETDISGTALIDLNNIEYAKLGTPTYQNLKDTFDTIQSAGIIDGGIITDAGSGTVDVSAVKGVLKTTNSDIGVNVMFDLAGLSGQALSDDNINYISVDYNAGTPQFVVGTSNPANGHTIFNLGKVYREGTTVDIITSGVRLYDMSKRIQQHHLEEANLHFVSGAVVSETGTLNIAISAGVMYAGLNRIVTDAIDTSVADDFEYYYYNGSAWIESDEKAIDNLQYNNIASGLATLSNNRYGIHWVYKGTSDSTYVVYGQASYTLNDAQAAQPPSSLPTHVTEMGVLRAKIVIAKSAVIFTEIESASETQFTSSAASNHNELAAIDGGAAGEYYHLTSNQYTNVAYEDVANTFAANQTIDLGGLVNTVLNINGSTHSSIRSTSTDLFEIVHNGGTPISIDSLGTTVTVTNTLNATNLGGTLSTAAQANVTSLGTLTGLSVSGTTGLDGAVTINESGADVDFRVEGVGEANALVVQGSDGNVGIGTASPLFKLDVRAAANGFAAGIFSDVDVLGEWTGLMFGHDSATDYKKGGIIFEGQGANARGKMHFALEGTAGAGNVGLADAKMTILYDGKVGIGTVTPSATLTLGNGDAIRFNYLEGSSQYYTLNSPSATSLRWTGTQTFNSFAGYDGTNEYALDLYDGLTLSVRIRAGSSSYINGGSLGIGIASPDEQLHVYKASGAVTTKVSTDTASNLQYASFQATSKKSGGSARSALLRSMYNSSSTSNESCGVVYLQAGDGAANWIWVDDSDQLRISLTEGHVGTTSGTVVGTQTSDERLKNDIKDSCYGLEEILKLEPINYSIDGVKKIGFTAQRTLPILPEAVFDTKTDAFNDSENTQLGMEYVQIIPVLTKAIQEQQEIIKELKKRIDKLEK